MDLASIWCFKLDSVMNWSKELCGVCAALLSFPIVCIDETSPLSSPAVNILSNLTLSLWVFFHVNVFEFVYA